MPQKSDDNLDMSNYSSHIFLFPFKWGKLTSNARQLFSDLTDFKNAASLMNADNRWETRVYASFSEPEDFNEYTYFYPTVRDVLYHQHADVEKNEVIRHYSFRPAAQKELKYIIEVGAGIDRTYELVIEDILLNFYKTGIGILSFHLKNENPAQQRWEDILAINDFGRRIYPPYFDYKSKLEFKASTAKGTSLAKRITIKGVTADEAIDITEDFETDTGLPLDYSKELPHTLQLIPNHIRKVLPAGFVENLNVHTILDDRMFVVSSIYDASNTYGDNIKSLKEIEDWDLVNKFYQYIYIDGPFSPGVSNKKLQVDILAKSLYTRWVGEGTLYGLSRYSLVSYTTWDKILVDTRTIYYKIAELCLLQRASVIKFSEEVRRIAALNENENRLSIYINDIYKNYIIFINKICFRDITPQEQGIELYDMLRDKMNIEKEVNDLDKEINELHEYATLQEERSNSSRLQLLTILGGLFIVPSFIMGFFGMSNMEMNKEAQGYIIPILMAIAFSSLITSVIAVNKNNHANQKYLMGISRTSWWLIIITMFVISILFFWLKASTHD